MILITFFIVVLLYVNIVRFAELKYLTNVYTLKDYFKYSNGISIVFNITLLIIFIIFYLIYVA